jgi:hypothetical protein
MTETELSIGNLLFLSALGLYAVIAEDSIERASAEFDELVY